MKRILRPGGVIRLAVPDLSRLVRQYVASGDADEFIASTYLGTEVNHRGLRARARWALAGPRHHLWMYDGTSLAQLLAAAGFTDAAIEPPGLTRIPGVGALDLTERAAVSVYVEATRP